MLHPCGPTLQCPQPHIFAYMPMYSCGVLLHYPSFLVTFGSQPWLLRVVAFSSLPWLSKAKLPSVHLRLALSIPRLGGRTHGDLARAGPTLEQPLLSFLLIQTLPFASRHMSGALKRE